MLVLTRKIGESVVCEWPDGREGWVTVVRIGPNSVRLGFEFADEVSIRRKELDVLITDEEAGRLLTEKRAALAAAG